MDKLIFKILGHARAQVDGLVDNNRNSWPDVNVQITRRWNYFKGKIYMVRYRFRSPSPIHCKVTRNCDNTRIVRKREKIATIASTYFLKKEESIYDVSNCVVDCFEFDFPVLRRSLRGFVARNRVPKFYSFHQIFCMYLVHGSVVIKVSDS